MRTPAEVRLRSFVTLEKGKPPAAQPYYGPDADRYLTPEYLRTGGECAWVKSAPRSAYVEDGDTILLWDGSNAGEVLYGRAGILASTMSRASPAGRFDDAYFFYALKQHESYLKGQTSGSGIPHIDKEIFGNLAIIEFDLREQSKIAAVLSTLDRAIKQTEALIAKHQRIKTGLMQDLLTRGIDEHGNLRSKQTHEFKDSSLGRIPVEWSVSAIGVEFDIQLGKMLSQASRQSRNPLPYLGNKNVQWDNVDLTNLERMDFDEGEREKFRLKSGDILVCEGGEVGRTCVWREELEECFYQKAVHRLRPKRGYFPSLFPTYMRWAVRSGLLSDFTSQSSIAHLTKEKLAGVPMCVPSKCEQMRISGAIEAIDRGLEIHRQQLAKLRALKRGLMQELLTGNRRVTALLEHSKGVTT